MTLLLIILGVSFILSVLLSLTHTGDDDLGPDVTIKDPWDGWECGPP